MLLPIEQRIAAELGVQPRQVSSAVQLLDEGATVPFVARYRKEVTGGLDDTQLRNLEERLGYLRELEERRAAVIASIDEQGKLDPALRDAIENAETKQRLEDLYLPFKQKRRTKAQIAREAGIAPLADTLLADPTRTPETEAANYINAEAGFADTKAVLDGARQILMERFAEDAELIGKLREFLADHGVVASTVIADKESDPAAAKFRDWFDFREAIGTVPSHRALALFRGRNEGFLRLQLGLDSDPTDGSPAGPNPCEGRIAGHFGIRDQGRPADAWLRDTVRWAWSVKISLHLELELLGQLREKAEEEAIRVFGRNLKDLLLAAPAGPRATLGLYLQDDVLVQTAAPLIALLDQHLLGAVLRITASMDEAQLGLVAESCKRATDVFVPLWREPYVMLVPESHPLRFRKGFAWDDLQGMPLIERPYCPQQQMLLPQALRVIIPPMTNQYLNLTKNSSLAVAIGYPDVVSIANTAINQTGRAVECIAIVMLVYLTTSLTTSLLMNWYNARAAIKER